MQSGLTLDAALKDLAAQLREDIPGMVERGLAQQRLELPEFFVRDDDPGFVEVYRQRATGNSSASSTTVWRAVATWRVKICAPVLRVTSRWLFAYIDWVTPRVTEIYERERDLLVRDRERRTWRGPWDRAAEAVEALLSRAVRGKAVLDLRS